jgi:hypothetical protein
MDTNIISTYNSSNLLQNKIKVLDLDVIFGL